MPVYLLDKPLALTSHDVVARARRALGTRRVGHAGTLDPLAGGLLVLLTEGATKLSPFLTGSDKEYLAWVAFGAATATLDAEGPITARGDPGALDGDAVASALPPFLELQEQRPPAFSAVKREGVRSYARARAGEVEALPPRPAGYLEVRLLAWAERREALPARVAPGPDGAWGAATSQGAAARTPALPPALAPLPTALLRLRVRAGTYVRAFARDLGEALACPAHLAGLLRTRSGALGLDRAVPLERLSEATPLPATEALPFGTLALEPDAVRRVRQGQRPSLQREGRVGLVDGDGRLVAVAERREGRTALLRVWPEGGSP